MSDYEDELRRQNERMMKIVREKIRKMNERLAPLSGEMDIPQRMRTISQTIGRTIESGFF
jgi:hypothetical protein